MLAEFRRALEGAAKRSRRRWVEGKTVAYQVVYADGDVDRVDALAGITTQQEEVLGKLIGILHEITPGARRGAIGLGLAIPQSLLLRADEVIQ